MRYCRECGIPLPFGRFLEWTRDGTILGRDPMRTRLVYLEVDEIRSLFSGVEERLGLSIDPLVYRAEKAVGRRFAGTLIPSFVTRVPRSRVTRPQWGIKLIGHFIFNYMAGLGMGRARVERYRSGVSATVHLEDVHSLPLVMGDGAGVFEHLERVGVDAMWHEERSGCYTVTLEKISDAPPPDKRLVLGKTVYLPGRISLDYCPRCGIPREITGNLLLELGRGMVRNRTTGAREVAVPAQSFFAVFRELERELKEEMPAILEELEREYMRESSGVRRYVDEWERVAELFSDFPWRGIGNPIRAERTDYGIEVVVENPFHPGMVAGRVAGLYEAWTESRVRADWVEDRPGRLKVTMRKVAHGG